MADVSFTTLASLVEFELIVKKSRFRVIASPVASAEEALGFFQTHHVPEASHNCWAYKIGNAYRFNDDGEPGGTAGKPILQAIEGQGLDGVAVLVVRWFGGVKLGAGGLVRAYGGSAAQCLRSADRLQVTAKKTVAFECSFAEQGAIRQALSLSGVSDVDVSYAATLVHMRTRIPLDELESLERAIAGITRGKSGWRVVEPDAA